MPDIRELTFAEGVMAQERAKQRAREEAQPEVVEPEYSNSVKSHMEMTTPEYRAEQQRQRRETRKRTNEAEQRAEAERLARGPQTTVEKLAAQYYGQAFGVVDTDEEDDDE